MNKYLKFIFGIFVLWFLVHSVFVIIDGLTDNYINSDVALILGNTIKENGEPSDRLIARLDKGFDLYKSKIVKRIIVSGGLGKEGFLEGDEMKKYLIRKGVKNDDIIVDNYGNTTFLTAFNYLKLKNEYNIKSVVIVSQYFHISRTRLILKNLGVENITSAHAKYIEWRDFYSIFREFFAYYCFLIFNQ